MILIVDDDNAVRMSLSLTVKTAGFEPLAVGNEAEALMAVRDERIELALLDLNLTLTKTGEQGLEILKKFQVLRPEMPVIIITAWGTIPLAVESINSGAIDFITKPWSNSLLISKIRKALASKKAEQHETTLEDMECKAISDAMKRCGGNLAEAARQLGITRQSLYRRIDKYKL